MTQADYERRKAAILNKHARADWMPHRLWPAMVGLKQPFAKHDLIERLDRDRVYFNMNTVNGALARLRRSGWLRFADFEPSYYNNVPVARYAVVAGSAWRLEQVRARERQKRRARQERQLAELEARWQRSPFSRLSSDGLQRLPQRIQDVLIARQSGVKLADIGYDIGVSRERIRQIQQSGFRRLNAG